MALSISSPLQTLVPLLTSAAIALFVILAMTSKAYSQSEATSFTYNFEVWIPNTLTYQGDPFVPAGSRFLRLTKADASGTPLPGSIGRILHSSPVLFRQPGAQASFETTVTFMVRSLRGDNQPADGLVFFIAPVGSTAPAAAAGGNLGVYSQSGNAPNIFAVEFDFYVNSIWDPNFRHIGINLGSRTSSNVTSFEGMNGQRVTARINYEAATKVITVHANSGSANFELSYVYDLGSLLPERVQVGIAASTGEHVAVHDVYSWLFSSTLLRQGTNAEMEGANIRQFV